MDNENKNDEYYTPYDESSQVNNPLMDKKSTTSMILGIIAIVCSFTWFLAPVGLVLGIIAVVKAKSFRKENGTAKAGYILGIIALIVSAILVIGFVVMMSHGTFTGYRMHSISSGAGFHGSYFLQRGPRILFRRF